MCSLVLVNRATIMSGTSVFASQLPSSPVGEIWNRPFPIATLITEFAELTPCRAAKSHGAQTLPLSPKALVFIQLHKKPRNEGRIA